MAIARLDSLEEIAREAGRLNVLIVSDSEMYRSTTMGIFGAPNASNVFEAQALSKKDLAHLVQPGFLSRFAKKTNIQPDIIVYDAGEETSNPIDAQLPQIRELGLKFPYASLTVTMDGNAHNRLFSENRDLALSSEWDRLRELRGSTRTEDYRVEYPESPGGEEARRVIASYLTKVYHNTFATVDLKEIYRRRNAGRECRVFAINLDAVNHERHISDQSIGAVATMRIPVVLVSGSHPDYVERKGEFLKPRGDFYLVAYNGALVLDRNKQSIGEAQITPHDSRVLLDAFGRLLENPANKGNILLVYASGNKFFTLRDESVRDLRSQQEQRDGDKYLPIPSLAILSGFPEDGILPHKIQFVVRDGYSPKDIKQALYGTTKGLTVRDSGQVLEFAHHEATIPNALERITRREGIHLINVGYVGKGDNDIDALARVGFPFVVGPISRDIYRELGSLSGQVVRVGSRLDDGISSAITKLQEKGVYRR